MKRRLATAFVLPLLPFLGIVDRAYAQRGITVSGGYQDMVYTIGQDDEPLPPGFVWVCPDPRRGCEFKSASYSTHGLYVDLAGHVSRNLAIVGEWQWNRSSSAGLLGGDPDLTIPGLNLSVQQFTAGPRLSVTRGRFVPFAQLLVGASRVGVSLAGMSESISAADLRVGGGVDVMFNDHVGLRGSAGYTHLFTSDVRNNLAHFGVGIVFRRRS